MDMYTTFHKPRKNQKCREFSQTSGFFCSLPLGFSVHLIDDGAKLLLHITQKEGGTPYKKQHGFLQKLRETQMHGLYTCGVEKNKSSTGHAKYRFLSKPE